MGRRALVQVLIALTAIGVLVWALLARSGGSGAQNTDEQSQVPPSNGAPVAEEGSQQNVNTNLSPDTSPPTTQLRDGMIHTLAVGFRRFGKLPPSSQEERKALAKELLPLVNGLGKDALHELLESESDPKARWSILWLLLGVGDRSKAIEDDFFIISYQRIHDERLCALIEKEALNPAADPEFRILAIDGLKVLDFARAGRILENLLELQEGSEVYRKAIDVVDNFIIRKESTPEIRQLAAKRAEEVFGHPASSENARAVALRYLVRREGQISRFVERCTSSAKVGLLAPEINGEIQPDPLPERLCSLSVAAQEYAP